MYIPLPDQLLRRRSMTTTQQKIEAAGGRKTWKGLGSDFVFSEDDAERLVKLEERLAEEVARNKMFHIQVETAAEVTGAAPSGIAYMIRSKLNGENSPAPLPVCVNPRKFLYTIVYPDVGIKANLNALSNEVELTPAPGEDWGKHYPSVSFTPAQLTYELSDDARTRLGDWLQRVEYFRANGVPQDVPKTAFSTNGGFALMPVAVAPEPQADASE